MLGQGRRLRRPLPQLWLLPPSSAEGGIVSAPAPLFRRSCPKQSVIVADPFRSDSCGVVSDFCMKRAAVYSNNHHFQVS